MHWSQVGNVANVPDEDWDHEAWSIGCTVGGDVAGRRNGNCDGRIEYAVGQSAERDIGQVLGQCLAADQELEFEHESKPDCQRRQEVGRRNDRFRLDG
jgi:hypothetical protein